MGLDRTRLTGLAFFFFLSNKISLLSRQIKMQMTFIELDLHPEILRGIEELGFVNPTPIQEQSIPQLLEGKRDLVGLAQNWNWKNCCLWITNASKHRFFQ